MLFRFQDSLALNYTIESENESCSIMSNSLQPLWPVARQAPLSMEFSRQEYWRGLPFPSLQNLPDLEIEPGSPTFQADSLLSEPPGKFNHAPAWGWT